VQLEQRGENIERGEKTLKKDMRHEAKVAKKAARRPYKAPRLTVIGTVEKITALKGPGSADGLNSFI
jgi:hypothetical protein